MTAPFTIPRNPNNPWEIFERYEDGGAKTYRHTGTGQILTKAKYRNLKAQGFDDSEAFSEPPELDASPEVDAPPPPPLRDWQIQMGGKGASSDTALFARIGPGIFNVARGTAKILLNRTGHELAADYIPPAALVTPVLTPLFRIADRHSPIKVDISGSADIADLLAAVAGAEKLIDYWSEQAAEHRALEMEYDDNYAPDEEPEAAPVPDAPYTGPSDRTPAGKERAKPRSAGAAAKAAIKSLGTWRVSSGQNSGGRSGNGRSASADYGGDDAGNGTSGNRRATPGVAIDPARSASIIRDLFAADAAGRLSTGLG